MDGDDRIIAEALARIARELSIHVME
jgi:hypothetical protein